MENEERESCAVMLEKEPSFYITSKSLQEVFLFLDIFRQKSQTVKQKPFVKLFLL
jgi:hypothetical protein